MDYTAARRIMVDSQIRVNDVTEPEIVDAFLDVPREAFVASHQKPIAYSELEIETSEGRSLWEARDFAKLLKATQPEETDIALVIGAGAGYEAAIISRVVDTALALEDDDALVDAMTERFAALGLDSAVSVKGPIADGLADQGPFDVILVCGMVESVPEAWTAQLSEGGRLGVVEQVDRDLGKAKIYVRSGDTFSSRDVFDCRPPKFDAFNAAPEFQF